MLKRGFTYFLLIHLLSAISVFSLTDNQLSAAGSPLNATHAPGSFFCDEEAGPLLDFIGELLTGTAGHNTGRQGDNFSDFFRIRKYNYRFSEADGFRQPENAPLLPAASVLVLKPAAYTLFGGFFLLPDYYQLLFRLTPF